MTHFAIRNGYTSPASGLLAPVTAIGAVRSKGEHARDSAGLQGEPPATSRDKTVRVWDAVTGQAALPPLEGHEDWVRSAAFSPDGTKIASGSDDKTVRVWDAVTGQAALPPLEGHEAWVVSVAFSPDGTEIVSRSSEGTARLWDAVTGKLLNGDYGDASIPHHTSPDKAQISLSLDERGYFTDVNSGHCLGKIPVGFPFEDPVCHGSRCVVWREATSHHWVPVFIHFPPA
ncbi:WD40 repeat-like protein [Athelia psychrophila]|uniref:WD40 repeat-like protein n=1 Tax=Athelia psychrophila TaxID=1759441 RepID=A0A167UV25_9AGAM|nr:WD40 repeat-like protein [Fibularhizoctonia sp. CBS 109695]